MPTSKMMAMQFLTLALLMKLALGPHYPPSEWNHVRNVQGRIRALPPFGVPPSGGFGASLHLPRKRGTPNG
jgi:hypothetical protein